MSEPAERNFREALIGSEPLREDLADRYRAKMQTLLERRLSPAKRWLGAAIAFAFLILGTSLSVALLCRPGKPPESLLVLMGLFVTFCVGFFAILLWIGVCGYYARRTHGHALILLVLAITGAGGSLLINAAFNVSDPAIRGRLILVGTVLLTLLGGVGLFAYLEEIHVRQQEILLRLELQVRDLGEQLQRRG
jgi:hypothetical protein